MEKTDYYEKYSSADAIILIDSGITLPSHETPIISVGDHTENADVTIRLDYESALKTAALDFKSSGVSRIGFIGEEHTAAKLAVFKKIVAEIFGKADEKYILTVPERFEKGGYAAARELYSSGALPEALICAYDDMALGAMRFLSEKNISVPGQIKILGMDNIPHSEYFVPSLSNVDFMNEEIAETAAESVFEILDGKTPQKEYCFSARLIRRESSLTP